MIHEFKNGHWVPGAEGIEGNHPFPVHPQAGTWFNDVTGTEGTQEADLVEGLPELLMKQGALADLLPVPVDWAGLMDKVRTCFDRRDRSAGLIASVIIRPDAAIDVIAFPTCDAGVAREAGQLALALVRANGQMDFLRREPWFGQGTHQVVIKIDVQLGRRQERLLFHKDTDGAILFNNLLFRNDANLLATEWSVDLQPMAAPKTAALRCSWPPTLLARVGQARTVLSARIVQPRIEGGLLPTDGYVSWVEELVWHATPIPNHRDGYTLDEVLRVLATADYVDDTADVLIQIAETADGAFAHLLRDQDIEPTTLSEPFTRELWQFLHRDAAWANALPMMVEDARKIDWQGRKRGTASVVIDVYNPATRDQRSVRQSTGMAVRPRSNSENLPDLLAQAGSDQRRDFFRVSVVVQPRT